VPVPPVTLYAIDAQRAHLLHLPAASAALDEARRAHGASKRRRAGRAPRTSRGAADRSGAKSSALARRSSGGSDDDENVTHQQVRPDPAFGLLKLYDDALPHVYGYLLARCGDTATAEDLTSESFMAAADAVRKPGAPEASVQWLIGLAGTSSPTTGGESSESSAGFAC
jgi:Sigma-70 region 2